MTDHSTEKDANDSLLWLIVHGTPEQRVAVADTLADTLARVRQEGYEAGREAGSRAAMPRIYDNRAVHSDVPTPVRNVPRPVIEAVEDLPRLVTSPGVHVIDARHGESHTIYTCAVCGYEGLDVPDLPCPGKPITGGGPCLAG